MKILASIHLQAALTAAGLAAMLGLAGCGGSGSGMERGKVQVDLRPVISQLNDRSPAIASASDSSPADITVPGASPTTDAVLSLVVGALVIDFTDTPLGPDSSITKAVQDQITDAVKNSIKYIKVVSLPVADAFITFDLPPPAAKHWEVFVVGTRDKINVLEDISDNSPIYFGFNTDASGKPYFLTAATYPTDPNFALNVVMARACIANTPPLGCAQFKDDRTPAVTASVEIIGVYLNGSSSPSSSLTYPIVVRTGGGTSGACNTNGGCDPSYVKTLLQPVSSGATSVKVETTHQQSTGQSPACAGATTVAGLRGNCGSQFYTTTF